MQFANQKYLVLDTFLFGVNVQREHTGAYAGFRDFIQVPRSRI